MIPFWRKSKSVSMTSSKGLTLGQLKVLRSLKVGDRLVIQTYGNGLITQPNFILKIMKLTNTPWYRFW